MQKALAILAGIITLVVAASAGIFLANVALQGAYGAGAQKVNAELSQIISTAVEKCEPINTGSAVLIVKDCTPKDESK